MEKTIIEINGVKMEVDLREARRVDSLRVGDRVKVLTKKYDGYQVNAGTVVGFEPFESMPTVIVAYLETSYSSVGVKFLYFNSQTKETEIIKAIDDDQLDIDKCGVIQQFDTDIAKKEIELEDVKKKKQYFIQNFKAYWPEMEALTA
jgi:hypothetical protein